MQPTTAATEAILDQSRCTGSSLSYVDQVLQERQSHLERPTQKPARDYKLNANFLKVACFHRNRMIELFVELDGYRTSRVYVWM